MSSFRPPQVPIQPQTYYTPGQPLGIPKAFTDPQFQQIEAYYRQRPDNEAAEVAALVSRRLFTVGTPLGIPQPRQADQVQATWRPHIEILQPSPAALTLSGPQVRIPRQTDQFAAYWRMRPDLEALELAVNIVQADLTPGTPLGIPQPVQGNQAAAYFRPRPDTEAAEEAIEIVNANFTPAQPLGIPNPKQTDQSQAIWRPRPDTEALELVLNIVQPDYTPSGAVGNVPAPPALQLLPSARQDIALLQPQQMYVPQPLNVLVFVVAPDYIGFEETPDEPPLQVPVYLTAGAQPSVIPPALPLQIPFTARWPIEWIVSYGDAFNNLTPGQPLGIPNPTQSDQTQATWRAHVEILQPAPPLLTQSAPPVQIPRQSDQFAAYFRERQQLEALEEATQVVDQPVTIGQPLGIPQPIQGNQTAAYWRQRWDLEAFEYAVGMYSDNVLQPGAAVANVPPLPLQMPFAQAWRYEWMIPLLGQSLAPFAPSQFVPALALQMPFGPQARYETAIMLQQPQMVPPPTPYRPQQSDQTAAYFRPRFENWQPPVKFTIGSPVITQGGVGERIVLVSSDRMILIVDLGGKQLQLSSDDRQIN
jgi:hypothetical protein